MSKNTLVDEVHIGLKIKSLELIFGEDGNEIINIPISAISSMNINHITKSIVYLYKGEYEEWLVCGWFYLELYKNEIEKSSIDRILKYNDLDIITLNFDNNTNKSYKVVWEHDKDEIFINKLQKVEEDKLTNNIIISVGSEYNISTIKPLYLYVKN